MNFPYFPIRTITALTTIGSAALACTAHGNANTTLKRPNIILFMVDDMGWQDTSLPFWNKRTHYNEVYETPNMERLGSQGMVFTQAYACSLSSASR